MLPSDVLTLQTQWKLCVFRHAMEWHMPKQRVVLLAGSLQLLGLYRYHLTYMGRFYLPGHGIALVGIANDGLSREISDTPAYAAADTPHPWRAPPLPALPPRPSSAWYR